MALDLTTQKSNKPLFRPFETTEPKKEIEDENKEDQKTLEPRADTQPPHTVHYPHPQKMMANPFLPYFRTPYPYAPYAAYPLWAFPYLTQGHRPNRPLCGRYVRSGPAASREVLMALKRKILHRQQMKYWAYIMRINQQQRCF